MGIRFSRYDDPYVFIHVSICSMIPDTDKAYIAGLFDGEGSIYFKRGIEKKKKHKVRDIEFRKAYD